MTKVLRILLSLTQAMTKTAILKRPLMITARGRREL